VSNQHWRPLLTDRRDELQRDAIVTLEVVLQGLADIQREQAARPAPRPFARLSILPAPSAMPSGKPSARSTLVMCTDADLHA
jgi:hypothetical protein